MEENMSDEIPVRLNNQIALSPCIFTYGLFTVKCPSCESSNRFIVDLQVNYSVEGVKAYNGQRDRITNRDLDKQEYIECIDKIMIIRL